MKYQRKPKTNDRQHHNAWQIATKGGELSRVSVARYRKAYKAAFYLDWLNDYADRCANYDNDASRYNEKTSQRMGERLEELANTTAEHLAPLGVEFSIYSHFYNIQDKKTKREIYIRL